ncbi:uncharacterized protein LOC101454506 isoform X2 [Ceratitis capitata]|uniref:uncharacterized protein LOC101454506 isoform X2 n=1 Tax=Ceratitis capitata TaxID=7213 RepID=UPI0006188887|nr:uncharacterized protein LOC101454506 isoform X2 [Ceratitis capitata]
MVSSHKENMAAENYHLKWDSHLSYLNSSVATLYKNEKFADVVLYSSSSSAASGNSPEVGIPTVGISAHKFILSSCSQFFATMFETAPIASPNAILYVVLPPELSHRAIQILVQYMYSGEATVANDILNEVLRGGEILKIRGLCRTSSASSSAHNTSTRVTETLLTNGVSGGIGSHYIQSAGNRQPTMTSITHTHIQPSAHAGDMYVVNKCPNGGGTSCGPRYAVEHLQQSAAPQPTSTQHAQPHQIQHNQHQFRGLGASVLPKDSPVIVKSPKLSQLGLLSVATSSSKHHAGGGISVNKEVAIDPDDKCCYQLNQLHVTNSVCNEMGCSGGCPMTMEDEQLRRRQRNQNDETLRTTVVEQQLEREYTERSRPPPDEHRDDIDMSNYDRHMRRGSGGSAGERIRDYFLPESYEHTSSTSAKSNNQFTEQISGRMTNSSPMSHSQNFLTIKQEPTDWTTTASAADSAHSDLTNRPKTPLRSPKQPLDFKMPPGTTVKLEVGVHAHSPQSEQDMNAQDAIDYDTRLACDTCKQSFDEPKSWVRHLESHTTAAATTDRVSVNMACGTTNNGGVGGGENAGSSITNGADALIKAYVPKKRRRVSQENNAGHVTLCCDLCSISFETPADWVRHLSNEHTEIELAMFNSKKDNEQKSSGSSNNNNNHHHHNTQQMHLKRYTHRSTYDHQHQQPANEAQSIAVSTAAPSTSSFSERAEVCSKKFSTHNSSLMAHKRNHNGATTTAAAAAAALNGVSVSVSTSVAPSSLAAAATDGDVSVISSVASSLTNEQISTSSQA